jgi:hypothetical protein
MGTGLLADRRSRTGSQLGDLLGTVTNPDDVSSALGLNTWLGSCVPSDKHVLVGKRAEMRTKERQSSMEYICTNLSPLIVSVLPDTQDWLSGLPDVPLASTRSDMDHQTCPNELDKERSRFGLTFGCNSSGCY